MIGNNCGCPWCGSILLKKRICEGIGNVACMNCGAYVIFQGFVDNTLTELTRRWSSRSQVKKIVVGNVYDAITNGQKRCEILSCECSVGDVLIYKSTMSTEEKSFVITYVEPVRNLTGDTSMVMVMFKDIDGD